MFFLVGLLHTAAPTHNSSVVMQAFSATSVPHVLSLKATPTPCRRRPSLQLHRRPRRHGCKMSPVCSKATDAAITGVSVGGQGSEKEIINPSSNKDDDVTGMIDAIRESLKSMGDGEISASAYDTAWVALVKKLDGGDGPQFPACLDWIVRNQLPDGSWGESSFFLVYDRIICTLACVVALKFWNIHLDMCNKGVSFIQENMRRLAEDEVDWMIVGFEVTFPSLLQMAKDMGLDIRCDDHVLKAIYDRRDLKLAKIPIDVLHTIPTTLLLSIEGMPGLDWTKLFYLQSSDGSFMSSPAPTAYALMQTGDKKCLEYLNRLVNKFNGGVPMNYPVDIFEHLWVVDRLDRLGISRYFESEIKECLDYVYRLWSPKGLAVTEAFPVNDIDDTAMGFRLLRLRGYHVSACVFKHFEEDGEFYCYPAQLNKSVTATYNLYRAAQIAFPCEDVLQRANSYSRAFLAERQSSNELCDKWVVPKDLPGEVGYALLYPWKASLPRIETRVYMEQYGATHDVWIGKVIYKMPLFCNDIYLSAAKADFRNFQRLCRLEWNSLERWYSNSNLQAYGVTTKNALTAYFLAAASIFEPNRAEERLAWAHTAILAEAILGHLGNDENGIIRDDFITKLTTKTYFHQAREFTQDCTKYGLLSVLHELIHLQTSESMVADYLLEAWMQWLKAWIPIDTCQLYGGNTALLLACAIETCSGRRNASVEKKQKLHTEHARLEWLTCSICDRLSIDGSLDHQDNGDTGVIGDLEHQVDLDMQELTRLVLEGYSDSDRVTSQMYLNVVKSFYYIAYSSPEVVDEHISKVIFEDVL